MPGVAVSQRINYLLPLDPTGEELQAGYKRLAKRALQKAQRSGIEIIRAVDPGELIRHYRLAYDHRLSHIPNEGYQRIARFAGLAQGNGQLAAYLARDAGGDIIAFYLVLSDEKFVYSVLGGSTGPGRSTGAFYLLTDAAIKDHSNTQRIFRFEGSDVPGIGFFNSQFGAYPVKYPHLLLNRLPFPLNKLKKSLRH
jgi:hypothetical protein